jgi:hypothetical protein
MKKYLFIFAFTLLASLSSCTDDIVIDLPEGEPKLVVQAWFKKGAVEQVVTLGMTTRFSEKGAANTPLNGATVVINCNDGNSYPMLGLDSGKYSIASTDFQLEVNKKYSLSIVTSDGRQYASSEETCRLAPKIDGHLVLDAKILKDFSVFFGAEKGLYTAITYREILGKGDSYGWKIYKNGKDLSIGNNFIFRNDDFLEDGGIIPYRLAVFPDSLGIGDTIRVEQLSLTEDVYDFFLQIQGQSSGGTPFSTPPAPVEGNLYNINNKKEMVLGTFIVSDMDSFEQILTKDNVYEELTPELILILSAEGQ